MKRLSELPTRDRDTQPLMGDTSVKLLANGLVPDEDGNEYITDFLVKPSDILPSTSAPTEDTTEGKKAVHSSGLWAAEEQIKEAYEKGPGISGTLHGDELVEYTTIGGKKVLTGGVIGKYAPYMIDIDNRTAFVNLENVTLNSNTINRTTINLFDDGRVSTNYTGTVYLTVGNIKNIQETGGGGDRIYTIYRAKNVNVTVNGSDTQHIIGPNITDHFTESKYIFSYPNATSLLGVIFNMISYTYVNLQPAKFILLCPKVKSLSGSSAGTILSGYATRTLRKNGSTVSSKVPMYRSIDFSAYFPALETSVDFCSMIGLKIKNIEYFLSNLNKSITSAQTITMGVNSDYIGSYNEVKVGNDNTQVMKLTFENKNTPYGGIDFDLTEVKNVDDVVAAANTALNPYGITATAEVDSSSAVTGFIKFSNNNLDDTTFKVKSRNNYIGIQVTSWDTTNYTSDLTAALALINGTNWTISLNPIVVH